MVKRIKRSSFFVLCLCFGPYFPVQKSYLNGMLGKMMEINSIKSALSNPMDMLKNE